MKINAAQLKNGQNIQIREAFPPDAAALNALIECVISTSPYTLTTPPELDLTTNDQANRIHQFQKEEGSVIFLAELDNQLIGSLDFKRNSKLRNRHWGEFGMGMRPAFRGLGLGRILLQQLLDWAKQETDLEKICLGVYPDNKAALHLYRSMDFIEEGRLVKAIKRGTNDYADEIRMYRFV